MLSAWGTPSSSGCRLIQCQNFRHTYRKSCILFRYRRTRPLGRTEATHRRLAPTADTDPAAIDSFVDCHSHTAVTAADTVANVAAEEAT